MSNLKYKHTAYTSAQWASLNPVIVENEIVIESDTKRTKIGNGISTYNELEYADANSVGNSLGSIKPTDAAPTPARNGNYTFSIGGDKPAWLTAEAGITEVKAGDGVAVVFTAPSTYSYTHIDVSAALDNKLSILENNFDKLKTSTYKYAVSDIADEATYQTGKQLNRLGEISDNALYDISSPVDISSQTSIVVSNHTTNSTRCLCFFDANSIFISAIAGNLANGTHSVPATAKYVRGTTLTGQRLVVQITQDIDIAAGKFETKADADTTKSNFNKKLQFGNDWYDPDFKSTYIYKPLANITANVCDFVLGFESAKSTKYNGEHVLKINSTAFSLQLFYPSFSKSYFNKLGYNNGEVCKIGMWIKFPNASLSAVRKVYTSAGVYVSIVDTDWHWVEFDNAITVTADNWQTFYFGVQGQTTGQGFYIKGLTLVNTSKNTWVGEQRSKVELYRKSLPFINQNPYVEKISTESPAYKLAYESTAKAFTKEIISVTDLYEAGIIEGIRFTGTGSVGSGLSINTFLNPCNFADIDNYCLPKKSGYFTAGFWIKINNAQSSGRPSLNDTHYTGMISNTAITLSALEENVWHWIEMPPKYMAAGIKNTHYKIVITVQASDALATPSFDICGITWGLIDNPFAFRFTTENIAKNSRYYKLKMVSYGDSITQYNKYQQFLEKNFGVQHSNRGIGSTTICNKISGTGPQAYVNADGSFTGVYPPDAQPPGTTLIEASMCRQERVNTIPADTQLLTIWGGTNDWNAGYALGNSTDAASDAAGASFWASWKSLLAKVQTRIPNAAVFIINLTHRANEQTVPNSSGLYVEQYREVIRQVAKMHGYPCIELNDLGVNDGNWTSYCASVGDVVHPSEKFFQMIGEKISKEMELYNQYNPVTSY